MAQRTRLSGELLDFAAHSNSSLKRLWLDSAFLPDRHFNSTLQHLPALEELVLWGKAPGDGPLFFVFPRNIWEVLSIEREGIMTCPNLKTLVVRVRVKSYARGWWGSEAFVSMARRRERISPVKIILECDRPNMKKCIHRSLVGNDLLAAGVSVRETFGER